jgi:RNA polymerase sigma-70 factor (ECF subfamily)
MAAPNIESPADLVSRIMAGEHHAEEELVARYSRGVSVILSRETRNAPIAEDLYQDTFALAIQKIRQGDLRDHDRLSGFVSGIAKNLAIEHFRRQSRREELDDDKVDSRPDTSPSQLDQLLLREKTKAVRQVMGELRSERDRQLLVRFYLAEEDKDAICAELELSSLHFNRVLFRARERYRELYEKFMRESGASPGTASFGMVIFFAGGGIAALFIAHWK